MADLSARDEWVRSVLGIDPARRPAPLSLVKLGKARLVWGQLRPLLTEEIAAVGAAVAREFADDDSQRAQVAAAVQRIEGLIPRFDATLEDQLDALLNAAPEARPKLAAAARATLDAMRGFIDGDPLMRVIDGNPAKPDTAIAAPMRAALSAIAAALP